MAELKLNIGLPEVGVLESMTEYSPAGSRLPLARVEHD
jgi:hypothetical protein